MREMRQFCTALLDGSRYGLGLENVFEVSRSTGVTPIPLATYGVAGLVNLRGDLIVAIDLRRCLGLPERPAASPARKIVVKAGGEVVGLLVDEVGDVVEADMKKLRKPPESLSGTPRELILGVHELEDGLLLVLDTQRVVTATLESCRQEAAERERPQQSHNGRGRRAGGKE